MIAKIQHEESEMQDVDNFSSCIFVAHIVTLCTFAKEIGDFELVGLPFGEICIILREIVFNNNQQGFIGVDQFLFCVN